MAAYTEGRNTNYRRLNKAQRQALGAALWDRIPGSLEGENMTDRKDELLNDARELLKRYEKPVADLLDATYNIHDERAHLARAKLLRLWAECLVLMKRIDALMAEE